MCVVCHGNNTLGAAAPGGRELFVGAGGRLAATANCNGRARSNRRMEGSGGGGGVSEEERCRVGREQKQLRFLRGACRCRALNGGREKEDARAQSATFQTAGGLVSWERRARREAVDGLCEERQWWC